MKVIYIGIATGENRWLHSAAETCRNQGYDIHVNQSTSETLDAEEKKCAEILDEVKTCDFILMKNHGTITYFKKFDRLLAAIKADTIPTLIHSNVPEEMVDTRVLFPYGDEEYHRFLAYLSIGCEENTTSLLLSVLQIITGLEITIPPVHHLPTEGFYHPSLPSSLSYADHITRLDPCKPTIGILASRFFSDPENHPIDLLIRAIESRGANTLPFFVQNPPSDITGAIGTRRFVEKYLVQDGKPIIDVLIINEWFSQITLSNPTDGSNTESAYNFFNDLNIPLLHSIAVHQPYEFWKEDPLGLSATGVMSAITWPEYDGQIISLPISALGEYDGQKKVPLAIPDRIERLADMALRWAELKRTPVHERKLALLVWQHGLDSLASAGGLDTPQSIIGILKNLQNEGYVVDHIPKTGNDLMEEMIAGLTNDVTWLSKPEMRKRSAGAVGTALYLQWFSQFPQKNQEQMTKDYGKPPGELYEYEGELCMPGILNGNIFLGIQPPRSGEITSVEQLIHAPDIVIPHHYPAYYQWLKHEFGAHAIIHMGTHGSLEWLPGKGTALSEECYPDLVMDDMPDIYPYIINDPGEAANAKRRIWATLIDYLIPAMMRAEGYGELAELDSILQEYFRAKQIGEKQKVQGLIEELYRIVIDKNLTHDLLLEENASIEVIEENCERLYDYLCETRDAIIKDGLHIFGTPPIAERFQEMIYSLTRLDNGAVPSLRGSVADALSVSLSELMNSPSEWNTIHCQTNGALLDMVDARCSSLLSAIAEFGYEREASLAQVRTEFGNGHENLETVVTWICDEVAPHLNQATDEITNIVRVLDAGYVPPGPSGNPTRGNAHLLPTGRNCYFLDPATIPSHSAWRTGKEMADQMIERYVKEKGEYPQRIAIVIWATDTMNTGGDDIAYVYWLMGLRPIWSSRGGTVTGLEVIPVQELGRPRIDVTLRISGLFRDQFPNLIQMIDEGVEMIASLDESDEVNFLAAHLKEDMLQKIKEGMPEEEAREASLIRIFGCPPGNYGTGLESAMNSSVWKDRTDLADIYTAWSAHAYGRKHRGTRMPELFREQFKNLDATVKNLTTREYDVLDVDDYYQFLGGINACVKAYGEKDPVSFTGDASDPDNVKTRLVDEEMRYIYRSRVLNPRWMEGLKPHGYRGAQEITQVIQYTFAWDATSDAADDWEYQAFAEHFLFNEENRQWIEENNPYALHTMTTTLLEAHERGFWETDEETIRKIQDIFLKSENILEQTGNETT